MTTMIEDVEVPAGHGMMSTLKAEHGDLRVMWDPAVQDEVEAARAQFDELRGKGYLAYRAQGRRGSRGEVIREFDPDAERIILVRQNVGG
jgi:hypothetical protein